MPIKPFKYPFRHAVRMEERIYSYVNGVVYEKTADCVYHNMLFILEVIEEELNDDEL